MPSFRIPAPLRSALPLRGVDVDLTSPGVSGTQPQPPITAKDPRLQAFLRVSFGALYDWNIETGAIAFGEQLDEMLGLPPGGFRAASRAGSSASTPPITRRRWPRSPTA